MGDAERHFAERAQPLVAHRLVLLAVALLVGALQLGVGAHLDDGVGQADAERRQVLGAERRAAVAGQDGQQPGGPIVEHQRGQLDAGEAGAAGPGAQPRQLRLVEGRRQTLGRQQDEPIDRDPARRLAEEEQGGVAVQIGARAPAGRRAQRLDGRRSAELDQQAGGRTHALEEAAVGVSGHRSSKPYTVLSSANVATPTQ